MRSPILCRSRRTIAIYAEKRLIGVRTVPFWLVLSTTIFALQASAAPDTVTGQVVLPGGSNPAGGAAVWLVGERMGPAAPLDHTSIDQRGKTFIPHILMITRGTSVSFPNNDTVFHNVFAYFEAKRFDLGMYPRGAVRHQTFDKDGIVALLCNVHPQMSAYIVVVGTPYYCIAGSSGRFSIVNVPPGTYTIHSWHESGCTLVTPLQVVVPVQGDPAPLSLTLGRERTQ